MSNGGLLQKAIEQQSHDEGDTVVVADVANSEGAGMLSNSLKLAVKFSSSNLANMLGSKAGVFPPGAVGPWLWEWSCETEGVARLSVRGVA